MSLLIVFAALSGALAVGAGAFGAHGAQGEAAEWLKTGAQYQMVHALAALFAAQINALGAAWMFVAGGAIFGVTLYLMALGLPRWLGAITPIGGVLLIGAWLWLAWSGLKG